MKVDAAGRVRFQLCGFNGCGETWVDQTTLASGRPDQVAAIIEEDAAEQGILLGEFEKRRLVEQVLVAQGASRGAQC